MLVLVLTSNAQAVFQIKSPASIKGFYNFGYGDSTNSSWNNGSLAKKSITADLALATGADSLAGSTLQGNYSGKIAVVYRGTYAFATKALNAQNAGAVAVIILNHGKNLTTGAIDSNEVFNLSGLLEGETASNATGLQVTIPVIEISLKDGLAISKALRNKETVTGYLGQKIKYDNDLALSWKYSLQPRYYTRNSKLTLQGEVSDTFAIRILNTGNLDQQNILYTASITNSKKQVIFSDTVAYFSVDSNKVIHQIVIPKGDTTDYLFFNKVFIPTSDFQSGHYQLKFQVLNYKTSNYDTIIDDYPLDNVLTSDFYVSDSLFSVVPLDSITITDPVTNIVKTYNNSASLYNFDRPKKSASLNYTTWSSCMVFKDPNASRLKATGVSFWAKKNDSLHPNAVLKGEKVSISFWEWDDNFNYRDTFMFNNAKNVPLVDNQTFTFTDSLSIKYQNVKFDDQIALEDNKKYAVCFTSLSDFIDFGFAVPNSISFTSYYYNNPYLLAFIDQKAYSSVFGYNYPFSMTLDLIENKASINELDMLNRSIKVYPNPASSSLNVSFELDNSSEYNITVTDLSGKVVYNTKSNKGNIGSNTMTIDTKSLNNGMYVLNITTNNSVTSKKFNVVQ